MFLISSPPPLPDFLLAPSLSDFQAFRRILVIAPGKKEITITIIAPGRRGASKALDIYQDLYSELETGNFAFWNIFKVTTVLKSIIWGENQPSELIKKIYFLRYVDSIWLELGCNI